MRVYLDYNASAPIKPPVLKAMVMVLSQIGNPSSVHKEGREARCRTEEARAAVATMAGCLPKEVVFTSGGTEANNLAVGALGLPIVVSAIEHPSIMECRSPPLPLLPVTSNGTIDLNTAATIIAGLPLPTLLSVMLVNNETGIIQPIAELAALAHQHGHFLHTDAVQAAGRIPIDFVALGADMMTLSAHKIGGPQGIGALVISERIAAARPLLRGGGQESGRRAGTENVSAIVGFGVAAKLSVEDLQRAPLLQRWRDELQQALIEIGGAATDVIGTQSERVSNTLCVVMHGRSGETQVMALDLDGVAISAGSACSSGKVRRSHVVQAMGYDEDVAASAVRISLGWGTTHEDLVRCRDAWQRFYQRT